MYTSAMMTDTDIRERIIASDDDREVATEIYEAFTRTRWVAADDAVGIMELSDFFNVGRTTVTNWSAQRFRNGMPEPIKKLGSGPVYSLTEVIRWWVNWKPVKGAKAGSLPITIDAEEYR